MAGAANRGAGAQCYGSCMAHILLALGPDAGQAGGWEK